MDFKLTFDFYGIVVEVLSEKEDLADRLVNDFSYFYLADEKIIKTKNAHSNIQLQVKRGPNKPFNVGFKYDYSSEKVSFYEREGKRYCFYHGEVETIYDFKKNEGIIKGENIHAVHEVTYLMILSLVGKELDRRGVHRLHALSFVYRRILFVGLFSSGFGKSTLISHFKNDDEISLLSEDSPLFDRNLDSPPFPIRIGINEDSLFKEVFKDESPVLLKRFRYGTKYLYPIDSLGLRIGGDFDRIILATGIKGNSFQLKKGGDLKVIIHLFREGIIGVGLPILLEYFWEFGFADFLVKTRIALSRTFTFLKLFLVSEKVEVSLSNNPVENCKSLKKELFAMSKQK